MKMYILVKETVPLGVAMVAVAHASLAAYLKFKDTDNVTAWLAGPFYKVVCIVNEKEFIRAKELEYNVVITEYYLKGEEVAIAFKPRETWPNQFKYFKLYK